jgi:hypothetical protein
MTPEDMVLKSQEMLEKSHKRSFAFPEEPVVCGLEANYWLLRAIYEKMK